MNFNENIPLRNQPSLVNNVPGASAIQLVLDNNEWVQQSGNPADLRAVHPQAAAARQCTEAGDRAVREGRQTVPNPTDDARSCAPGAGGSRAVLPQRPGVRGHRRCDPKNPHTFLTNIGSAPRAYAVARRRRSRSSSPPAARRDRPGRRGPDLRDADRRPLPETLNFLP
jgi:hypothetical protein